ncbi:MAG: AraC family transcriptional regulator [Ahrensia sp.]
MQDFTIENYFRYMPESRLCHALGCTLQATGFTRVQRHDEYPAKTHPEDHLFSQNRGRVLQAYQIVYISEGKGRAKLGHFSKNEDISAGQVFVLFPNVWHRYAPDMHIGWCEHWVECKGTAFDMATNAGLLDAKRPIFRNTMRSQVENTFLEIHDLARKDAVGNQPVLSMLGLKLLAILAGPRNANEHTSNKLINAVRMRLMESCVDNHAMQQVAEEFNVSYSSLRRIFREHTGMSMKDYQLTVRMQKAKDLLDNTDLSIKGVAAQLGFSSAFHFSNQFRKLEGLPPSEWRARPIHPSGVGSTHSSDFEA